jgi:hypothetical protein
VAELGAQEDALVQELEAARDRVQGGEEQIERLQEMARRHGDEWDKERAQLQGEVSLDTYLGRC